MTRGFRAFAVLQPRPRVGSGYCIAVGDLLVAEDLVAAAGQCSGRQQLHCRRKLDGLLSLIIDFGSAPRAAAD